MTLAHVIADAPGSNPAERAAFEERKAAKLALFRKWHEEQRADTPTPPQEAGDRR